MASLARSPRGALRAGGPGRGHGKGKDQCPDSRASVIPSFDVDALTGQKHFTLNTCMTTPYGPPWANILLKPENFLECRGTSIALCYYSGPESSVTPCELEPGGAIANCTCYEIPPGRSRRNIPAPAPDVCSRCAGPVRVSAVVTEAARYPRAPERCELSGGM